MPALAKHAIGVLSAFIGIQGIGFIYAALTVTWGTWLETGETAIAGIICIAVAVILFRIWKRAMGNMPSQPRTK